MKKIFKILFSLLFTFLFIGVIVSLYAGNVIYDYTLNSHSEKYLTLDLKQNQKDKEEAMAYLNEKGESVTLKSHDSLYLEASYLSNQSSTYIIMIHGYRGERTSIIYPIKKFYEQGYNLLIPDLRGHGKSEGDAITMGVEDRLDVLDWIQYIIERDEKASIILYGVSMGGATVMNVSGEDLPHQVKAIIEDCGYSDVWQLFDRQFDFHPLVSQILEKAARLITYMRAGYDFESVRPIEQVKKSKVPLLFIHGSNDDFVPVSMCYDLYHETTASKEILITSAHHANSCAVESKLYFQTIIQFIRKYA